MPQTFIKHNRTCKPLKSFVTYLSAQPEQRGQGSVQVLVFPYKPQLCAQQELL